MSRIEKYAIISAVLAIISFALIFIFNMSPADIAYKALSLIGTLLAVLAIGLFAYDFSKTFVEAF